jgi:hypothetical protein
LIKFTPEINFINVLQGAFIRKYPK